MKTHLRSLALTVDQNDDGFTWVILEGEHTATEFDEHVLEAEHPANTYREALADGYRHLDAMAIDGQQRAPGKDPVAG